MRRRSGRPGLRAALTGICVLLPVEAHPQSGYRAVNGETSIAPRVTGFARADFAEISLSLQYVLEFPEARMGLAPYASAAARKGQFDLFSAFDFTPGFEGGVLGFVRLGASEQSLSVASLTAGFRNTERKLFAFNDDSTTVGLTETTQWDLVVAAGLTLHPGLPILIGLGGSVRREWSSPGTVRPVEICVESAGLTAPLCTDRYAAPLQDHWAGQIRGDVIWDLMPLGTARSLPWLAVLGGASVDLGQESAARLNLGAGAGVTTKRFPGQPIVVLFVEVYDITDANEQALTLSDQLVTRMSLTIPFALLRPH
jgi:hypothetical protein